MRVLVSLVIATGSLFASEPVLWRYAHPDAQALAGVDWRGVTNSEIASLLRDQFGKSIEQTKGLEFVEQLDRIFLSTPGRRGAAPSQEPPMLVAMNGKFNFALLRKNATVKRYKSVEWITPKDSKDGVSLAVVSADTVLAGDPKSLMAAIDRRAQPPVARTNPLFARAAELADRYEAWFVADSPQTLSSARGAPGALAADLLDISGGIRLRGGLGFDIGLNTKSQQSAQKLAMSLQALLSVAMAQKSRPGVSAILNNLRIAPEQTAVKLSMAMDNRQVEALVAGVRSRMRGSTANMEAAFFNSVRPAVKINGVSALRPATPPERQVIRIYGLDDGVREVPFSN